jgi:serine/threonine protein kinase
MSHAPSRGAALLKDRLRRWRAGQRLTTEDYFALHPEARQDPDLAAELIRQEFRLRHAAGEAPSPDEFLARFPEFSGPLTGRLSHAAARRDGRATGPGPHLVGRYRVYRRLGESEGGVLFKAFDPRRRAKVAVKLLRVKNTELDAADLGELRRSAAANARIRHPHVARLHGMGSDGRSPYLVREYVSGVSLADWLRRRGKARDIRRAAGLVCKVANGLAVMHEAGLAHGSVRPGNILLDANCDPHLTDPDLLRRSSLKVCDRRADSGEYVMIGTGTGLIDRAAQRELTLAIAADVHSLGVVTHQLLTGVLPDHNPPLYHRPDLDPVLEQVLKQALARRPSDRFPTAREFAAALAMWLKRQTFC